MDILGVSLWFLCLTCFMAFVVLYTWNMSKDLNIFERLGVTGPPPFPILGNFGLGYWMKGVFKSQVETYHRYSNKKVYGTFDAGTPILHISDCDMIHDILVTHFDHFVDRPKRFDGDPLMDACIHSLHGDAWRQTRATLCSALNLLKSVPFVIQRASDAFVNFLKPKIDWRRRIELLDLALFYTTDVHCGLTFGGNFKTFERLCGKNTIYTERLLKQSRSWRYTSVFFPFMSTLLRVLRFSVVPKSALKFCNKHVEDAIQKKNKSDDNTKRRQCFIDVLTATSASGQEGCIDSALGYKRTKEIMDSNANGTLSKPAIQAHAFTLIHSGIDKVSKILSFTLFLLANHPDECQMVQEEIDDYVGTSKPDEKNVQYLQYLDQCISETIRMYPPYTSIDRVCTKGLVIQGVRIPTNMIVRVPLYALHHDPSIWSEPDEFCPSRFDKQQKDSRHPCAFLPFGMGPRSCLGMDLALLELKIAIVYILRVMTPIPCPKTIFPIKLSKWKMEPEDELWVKVRPRFWL